MGNIIDKAPEVVAALRCDGVCIRCDFKNANGWCPHNQYDNIWDVHIEAANLIEAFLEERRGP